MKGLQALFKSPFLKGVAILASGTTFAQLAPIIFSPVLSRVFSPEDFGFLALFLAVSTFLSNVSMFRYEYAIVLPKTDREAVKVVALSSVLLAFSFLFSIAFIFVFRRILCNLLNEPKLYNWLLLVPFYVLIQGVWRILNYWSTRKEMFRNIAIGNVLRTYSNSIISLGLGFIKIFKTGGLVIGAVLGQVIETLYLLFSNGKVFRVIKPAMKKHILKSYAVRYKNFLLINTPHVIIDNVNNQGSPFIIAYFFDKNVLGLYSFMMRILRLPVSLVGSAISQVFYRTIAERYANDQPIYRQVRNIVIRMSLLALAPTIILLFFAPSLFAFVFGEKWRIAGDYASILSIYMFSHFVVSCLSFVPYVLGKMKFDFLFSTFCNLLFLLIIILGAVIFHDFKIALYLITGLISVLYWGYVYWILKISRK